MSSRPGGPTFAGRPLFTLNTGTVQFVDQDKARGGAAGVRGRAWAEEPAPCSSAHANVQVRPQFTFIQALTNVFKRHVRKLYLN